MCALPCGKEHIFLSVAFFVVQWSLFLIPDFPHNTAAWLWCRFPWEGRNWYFQQWHCYSAPKFQKQNPSLQKPSHSFTAAESKQNFANGQYHFLEGMSYFISTPGLIRWTNPPQLPCCIHFTKLGSGSPILFCQATLMSGTRCLDLDKLPFAFQELSSLKSNVSLSELLTCTLAPRHNTPGTIYFGLFCLISLSPLATLSTSVSYALFGDPRSKGF